MFGAFFVLVVVLPAAVTFYTDWLWFGETGYQAVFVRTLTAQGLLGGAAADDSLFGSQTLNGFRSSLRDAHGVMWKPQVSSGLSACTVPAS